MAEKFKKMTLIVSEEQQKAIESLKEFTKKQVATKAIIHAIENHVSQTETILSLQRENSRLKQKLNEKDCAIGDFINSLDRLKKIIKQK